MKLEESNKDNAIKRYEAYVKDGRPEQACIIKMGDDMKKILLFRQASIAA